MPTAQELYEEGLQAARSGSHDHALNCFMQAVQRDGQAEYLAALGNVFAVQGDTDSALYYLKQACEKDTSSAEHRSDLAGVLFQRGQFGDAIHFYQEAVEGDPTNAEAFYRLACAHYYQSRPNYERARVAVRQAAALYPTHPEYQRLLGLASYRLGDYTEATDAFRAASRLQPDADLLYNLACAQFAAGEFEGSAEAAEQALDLDEDEWEPKIVRHWAVSLYRCKRWEKALEALELASQLHPEDVELLEFMADAWLQSGKPQQAARSLQRATLLQPEQPRLQYSLGTAWLQAGQPERAVAALRACVRLQPELAAGWNNLALCLHLCGQNEAAREAIEKALSLQPDHPTYRETQAQIEGE